jgi:hypothetical protein
LSFTGVKLKAVRATPTPITPPPPTATTKHKHLKFYAPIVLMVPSIKPDALSKAADLASDFLKPTGGNGALVPRDGNRRDDLVTSTVT